MVSNPLFILPDIFCIFRLNFAMATLGLKEMGKSLWEDREKGLRCWLSQFSKTSFSLPSQRNFPISFKLKVAKAKLKKICYYEKWVGHHASFPSRRSVK